MEPRGDAIGGNGGSVGGVGSGGSSRFISQIFWPEHCLSLGSRRGYLIGWNTAEFKCLVVTLVTADEETGLPTLAQTERALEILAADPRSRTLNSFCSSGGAPPTVLGEWLPNGPPQQYRRKPGSGLGLDVVAARAEAASEASASRRQSASIWLTVGQRAGRPVLRSLYCCGCAYRTCCYVVFYRPCNPDALEYLPTLKNNASIYHENPDADTATTNHTNNDDDGGGGGGDLGGATPAVSTKTLQSQRGGNASSSVASASSAASAGAAAAAASIATSAGHFSSSSSAYAPAAAAGAANASFSSYSYASGGSSGGGSGGAAGSSANRRGDNPYVSVDTVRDAGGGGNSASGGVLRRGRVGHGTALVSPSVREKNNAAAGDSAGGGGGGGGGEPTDLDFAIRQVSCALPLERALRSILQDMLLRDKRKASSVQAAIPAEADPTTSIRNMPAAVAAVATTTAGEPATAVAAALDGEDPTATAAVESGASESAVMEPKPGAGAGANDTPQGGGDECSIPPGAGEGLVAPGGGEERTGGDVTCASTSVPAAAELSESAVANRSEPPADSELPAASAAPAARRGSGKRRVVTFAEPSPERSVDRSDRSVESFFLPGSEAPEEKEEYDEAGEEDEASRGGAGGMPASVPGRVFLDACCVLLRVFHCVAFFLLRVLEAKIVWTPLGDEAWRAPSDTSLACAHLVARLRGAVALPFRLGKAWRERYQPTERRAEGLVSLSHGLFGLAADTSLGVVACVLLLRHTDAAARAAHRALHLLHVDVLREELEWLNYFPAGFKLNVPLTLTLGSGTLVGMEVYASIVGQLAHWEGAVMTAIAVCAAAGGLTAALAVCHDVLRLLTLHTATAHTAFAALHNLHSSLLGSLWQLFRGRKRNVLRRRVDTCMYDACQLLLGTLVFTVLFFLSPTIAVYYTFFCIVQAVAVGGQAVLMCMFVLINELPVYRMLLLLTTPERLLAGFQLQVLDAPLPSATRETLRTGAMAEGNSEGDDMGFRSNQASWQGAGDGVEPLYPPYYSRTPTEPGVPHGATRRRR